MQKFSNIVLCNQQVETDLQIKQVEFFISSCWCRLYHGRRNNNLQPWHQCADCFARRHGPV